MGHTHNLRCVSGDNRRTADLGPGTSGTLSPDLYATAVAQLAGQRRLHHRRIYTRARVALCGELGRLNESSTMVDDYRHSIVDLDRVVHGVSVCAGEGTRHVAKPIIAAASVLPGVAIGFSDPVTGVRGGKRHDGT